MLVVALVGGVAWAETQVVATPPGQDATVIAVLVPGPGGGEVCGDTKGSDHILFSIGGDIVVNGEVCAVASDPQDTYTVTLQYRHEMMGLWFIDITVENDSTGELVYMSAGQPRDGMPGSVSATGETIRSLVVLQ